jgi:hypothetical protein
MLKIHKLGKIIMNYKQVQKYLQYAIYLFSAVLCLLIGLSMLALEATKKPLAVRERIMNDQVNISKVYNNLPKPWPPEMNKTYVDFGLVDQDGKSFRISDLKGKVILIEMVDMTRAESHIYSGSPTYGSFTGAPQIQVSDPSVMPIINILNKYSEGKIVIPDPDLVLLKIIFYNTAAAQPTAVDATNWANHFKLSRAQNIIVAVPEKDMRSSLTSAILPGFQLIDRNYVLRVDSTGATPKHSLSMTLVPLIPNLLDKPPSN